MNDSSWQQVEAILDQVLDLPEDQRKKIIDKQCEGQPELKSKVTQLLNSIDESEGWLENAKDYKKEFYEEISDDVELLAAAQSLIGKQIGSYIIKEKIGEGGMGLVYMAEHCGEDFDHKVAIKIIRTGKATDENARRFKREQRILAGLNHAGIAKFFDAGITGEGFPYIIMEHVDGIPLNIYCQKHNCSIEDKIALFEKVLEAVRHAHENLVIHRDLKPGNILVDREGNIKILDFGISKLLEDEEDQALTKTGARLLTPRYAAPEQVRQENITTSTDLYALGIVFYELLSGEHPLDLGDLSGYETEQAILNQEAENPSSNISNLILKKTVMGDLDAIALKAIRKEYEQRYRVANEFLEDLNNYKNGLPVSAAEDSLRYRSQKFFKRNRQGAVIAAGIFLLIIGLSGFYTWRIAQERDMAQLEAQKAEQITTFLTQLFQSSDPSGNDGRELTAEELLDRGYQRIEDIKNPAIHANMLTVIGQSYSRLGFGMKAENILDDAIINNQEVFGAGSLEKAEALFQRGIAERLNYDIALPYYRKAYKIRTNLLDDQNPKIASTMTQMAIAMRNVGKLDSAEYYALKALKIYEADAPTNDNFNSVKHTLAYIYREKEKYQESEELYLDLIQTYELQESPENRVNLATYYNNLAFIYRDLERYEDSETYLRKSLTLTEQLLGKGHANTINVRGNLAANLSYQSKFDEVFDVLVTNLMHTTERYGEDHWKTASKKHSIAKFLLQQKEYDSSQPYLEQSVSIYNNALGSNHVWTSCTQNYLAASLYFQGKTVQADSIFTVSYDKLKKAAPDFRPLNKRQIQGLIEVYKSTSDNSYKRQTDLLESLLAEK